MNTFPLLLNLRILNQPIAGKTGQHGFLELFFPDFIPAFIYPGKTNDNISHRHRVQIRGRVIEVIILFLRLHQNMQIHQFLQHDT